MESVGPRHTVRGVRRRVGKAPNGMGSTARSWLWRSACDFRRGMKPCGQPVPPSVIWYPGCLAACRGFPGSQAGIQPVPSCPTVQRFLTPELLGVVGNEPPEVRVLQRRDKPIPARNRRGCSGVGELSRRISGALPDLGGGGFSPSPASVRGWRSVPVPPTPAVQSPFPSWKALHERLGPRDRWGLREGIR